MENELFPEHEAPPPPPSITAKLKHLLRGKFLIIGLILLTATSMGTYILVSPAQKQKELISIVAPVIVPTPTPTKAQAPGPTAVLDTPTPQPTEIPTPTITPTPTIPPATAWKTYTNSQKGYRIKYSPAWMVKDLGVLEPKIPSYVAFNTASASDSSRFITIGVTTRTYAEQLALGAASAPITVAGIKGTKQSFQDSDGNTATVVILPRSYDLLVLRAKTPYLTIFNLMLSTLYITQQ
jgi:hypothetical protein